jgi:hypothetical protein
MPLNVYPDIYASGVVPKTWMAVKGGTIKYLVKNKAVLRELRRQLKGKWKKVIKQGNFGEVHYF